MLSPSELQQCSSLHKHTVLAQGPQNKYIRGPQGVLTTTAHHHHYQEERRWCGWMCCVCPRCKQVDSRRGRRWVQGPEVKSNQPAVVLTAEVSSTTTRLAVLQCIAVSPNPEDDYALLYSSTHVGCHSNLRQNETARRPACLAPCRFKMHFAARRAPS